MKFVSQYKNHRLVMVPTRMMVQDGMSYSVPGQVIEFTDHAYGTTDKKEIDFIKKHKLFDSVIFEDKQAGDK